LFFAFRIADYTSNDPFAQSMCGVASPRAAWDDSGHPSGFILLTNYNLKKENWTKKMRL